MNDPNLKSQILGGVLGLAVGDALGVPVEFESRESLRSNPVTDMRGYGTHSQPPGTWSDDTSLTLCLLDSLTKENRFSEEKDPTELDYDGIMKRFLSWIDKGKYTAHGKVFDVGIATRKALQRFRSGTEPLKCGGTSELDNGNGSLMRILPIVFYLLRVADWLRSDCFAAGFQIDRTCNSIVDDVSSLTHDHQRSHIACGLYWAIACNLLYEKNLKKAIRRGLQGVVWRYKGTMCDVDYAEDFRHYQRILKANFAKLPEAEIKSSGYVVDTLEAALWCLLNTNSYKDCVLKAVNLGEDTDTVAAVAGGLAGMFYGVDAIPKVWLNQLARLDYIKELCEEFYGSLSRYSGEDESPCDTPSRHSPKTSPKLPTKFSYKVTDTFYAGEYPFEIRDEDGIPKLQRLIDFGIKTFIDLTAEQLTKYAEYLPEHCTRIRFPTIDYTSPDFATLREIHTQIDEAEQLGEKIYVHCRGGYDRTGVVVATYFIHAGCAPAEAKQKFYEVFVPPVRGRYARQPFIETKWEILEKYQEWLTAERNDMGRIELIAEPHHVVSDVACPYCKKRTLGVAEMQLDDGLYRYTMQCYNAACVCNMVTGAAFDFDLMLPDILPVSPVENE